MKGIYLYMTMCMAAMTFTSCTNDLEESLLPTETLVLTVGDYPAFQERTDTRAIGTFDPGKTAWASDDKVLVRITEGDNLTTATLTYNGSSWTADKTLTCPEGTFTLEAWYAPAYSWNSDELSSTAPGTGEFLQQTLAGQTERNIEIDFSGVQRTYSRLRFVSSTNTPLGITLSGFTPAGDDTSQSDYTATLTTDSKGNAYLYGSWNEDVRLTVSADYLTTDIEKTLGASTPAQSYALDTPQTITEEELKKWCGSATDITGYYRLEADIDLSDDGNWTPIGNATINWVQGRFIGTFDGDGHTITGLTSNSGGNFGLFRTIGEGGVVKNMNISCNISGNGGFKGGIAANNYGTIENCHVSGTISGSNRIGGIAGYNTYTTTSGAQIIACSNTASINGTEDVGGICGDNNQSTVLACYNTGKIKKDSEDGGAICGYNRGSVTSCYYTQGTGVGTQVTEWNDAIDDMNSALQTAGYSYQYELGSNELPVIKTME